MIKKKDLFQFCFAKLTAKAEQLEDDKYREAFARGQTSRRKIKENLMKIAATYDVTTNTIFQHFGKTKNFKLYEIENNQIKSSEVIDNGGFGHHDLATYLKNLGVETLILGNRGQGAIDALNNAGIKQLAGITGNPDDAVAGFLNGTLKDNPDAKCNHHGEHHDHTPPKLSL